MNFSIKDLHSKYDQIRIFLAFTEKIFNAKFHIFVQYPLDNLMFASHLTCSNTFCALCPVSS